MRAPSSEQSARPVGRPQPALQTAQSPSPETRATTAHGFVAPTPISCPKVTPRSHPNQVATEPSKRREDCHTPKSRRGDYPQAISVPVWQVSRPPPSPASTQRPRRPPWTPRPLQHISASPRNRSTDSRDAGPSRPTLSAGRSVSVWRNWRPHSGERQSPLRQAGLSQQRTSIVGLATPPVDSIPARLAHLDA